MGACVAYYRKALNMVNQFANLKDKVLKNK